MFYWFLLYSVLQNSSAAAIRIFPPSGASLPSPAPPLQVITEHQIPCVTQQLPASCPFTSAYTSGLLSQFPPSSPTVCTCPFATSPLLCNQLHQYHFYRLSLSLSLYIYIYIYIYIYMIFVFLFLTCFTLYYRLQVHPSHYH